MAREISQAYEGCKPLRLFFPIASLGAHRKNRGGVCPAGVRCRSLCVDVATSGFLKEEVNHCGVVVEETPYENVSERGSDYKCMRAFNVTQSSRDDLLAACWIWC